MKKEGEGSFLPPVMGCLISLAALGLSVPSVFGYEVIMYQPAAFALLLALAATGVYGMLIFGKIRIRGPGLAALSMGYTEDQAGFSADLRKSRPDLIEITVYRIRCTADRAALRPPRYRQTG